MHTTVSSFLLGTQGGKMSLSLGMQLMGIGNKKHKSIAQGGKAGRGFGKGNKKAKLHYHSGKK